MANKVKSERYSFELDSFVKYLPIYICVVIITLILVYFVPRWFYSMPYSLEPSVWGAIGDFFGGILNPVLSVLTILLLVRSLQMQSKELLDASSEMRLTREVHTQSLLYEDTKRVFEERAKKFIKLMEVQLSCSTGSGGIPNLVSFYSSHQDIENVLASGDEEKAITYLHTLQHLNRELFDCAQAGLDLLKMNVQAYILRENIELIIDEVISIKELATLTNDYDVIKEGVELYETLIMESRIVLISKLR